MTKPFRTIYLEISGICNGKCPYCLSGRYKMPDGKFIAVDVFEQILKRLTELRIVGTNTILGLYNWGEPFLHPRLGELVAITNRFEIPYSFSTNAAIVPDIDRQFVKGLKMIIFSMPGFSQSSYDRIHGFDFQSICRNIQTIVDRARSAGYKGIFRIHYHVYQFNMNKISQAEIFSRRLGIAVQLHYAILNHWDNLWAYVDSTLPYSMLKEASQDLFLFRLRNLVPDSVKSYRCPQYNLLVIDENANVPLCCQVPKGDQYSAGNILDDDINGIFQRRERNDICSKCISTGMARYLNTALEFSSVRWPNRMHPVQQIYRRLRNRFG